MPAYQPYGIGMNHWDFAPLTLPPFRPCATHGAAGFPVPELRTSGCDALF